MDVYLEDSKQNKTKQKQREKSGEQLSLEEHRGGYDWGEIHGSEGGILGC